MCGFVALISLNGQKPDSHRVAQMTDVIAHRGPDDRGQFSEHAIALGFRRLAILDTAPSGHQPMHSADGRHVIVFNGAIYNFIELRAELQALGHTFRSTGDTEVLLAAYRQWGRECLPRLNGMWAFLVYDRVERRIFGARDRFGIKPLYWYRDARSLLFASEIKAIREYRGSSLAFNRQTIEAYIFDDSLDASEETFYEGVRHVPAGTAFECDAYGNLSWQKYWSLDSSVNQLSLPKDPAASYAELFNDAIRLRMRSDVPVGVQLSGGLDSTSIIAGVAQEMKSNPQPGQALSAFCYLDPQFDESEFIQPTLAQTQAELAILNANPKSMWNSLAEHLWYHDEPVQSFSSVAGYQLMGLARSRGVKVLLNGQGADEVLGGYPSYFKIYWAELIRRGGFFRFGRAIRDTARLSGWSSAMTLGGAALQMALRQSLRSLPGSQSLAASLQTGAVHDDPWISEQCKREHKSAAKFYAQSLREELQVAVERWPLPLYLRVEDRNAMAHGIETRVPFLDHRLVTLAFRLGGEWKLDGVYTKWLLRQAMRGRIPEIVRTRVPKFGFPTGMDTWFRAPLYEPLRDLFSTRAFRESGLWNVPQIERDLELHRLGTVNVGQRLFEVAQLALILQGLSAPVRQQRQVGAI